MLVHTDAEIEIQMDTDGERQKHRYEQKEKTQRTSGQWFFEQEEEDRTAVNKWDTNRQLDSKDRGGKEKQGMWQEKTGISGTSTAMLKSTMETLVLRCQQTCTVVLPR